MSIDFTIALTPESTRFLARLDQAPVQMQKQLLRVIDRENLYTVGKIQSERLSRRGPDTLGVVTNRLRSSLRAARAVLGAAGEILSSIGSNVLYAAVHEFGFDGEVTVRAHTRRIFEKLGAGSTIAIFDPRTGRISRRKRKVRQPGVVQVREHERHMVMPARAYIRRTLQERSGNYTIAIGQAVIGFLHG